MEDLKSSKVIFVTSVPEDVLDKRILRRHFSAFGDIRRISIDAESACCSVLFTNVHAAQKAYLEGNVIQGRRVKLILGTSLSSSVPQNEEPSRETHAYDDLDMQYLEDDKDVFASGSLENDLSEKDLLKMKKNIIRKIHSERDKGSVRKAKKTSPEGKKSKEGSTVKRVVERRSKLLKKSNTAAMSTADLSRMRRLEKKYELLDLRDKLYREKLKTSKLNLKVGTCPDMCPEKERIMRAYRKLWAPFEQQANSNRLAPELAVKEYSRSSANQEEPLPHELRPEPVLSMTLNYLVANIMPLIESPDVVISEWYDFLWDRLRGIRKDIVQQQLCSVNTAQIIEQCARFHILCFDRLSGQDVAVFDEKINTENLNNCLQSLLDMYDDLNERGQICPNEPEFRAYEILAKLDRGDIIWEFQKLSPRLQSSPLVLFALQAFSAFKNNMFSTFFKLVRKTTYLNACLLQRYFGTIRSQALQIIVTAFCRPQDQSFKAAAESLKSMLHFDSNNEVVDFCKLHGMECTEDGDLFIGKYDFSFPPRSAYLSTSLNAIKSKRCALPLTVTSTPELPQDIKHKVHSSFDAHGNLRENAVNTRDQIDKLKKDFGFSVDMPVIDIAEMLFSQQKSLEKNSGFSEPKQADSSIFTSKEQPSSSVNLFSKPVPTNLFKSQDSLKSSNPFKKDITIFSQSISESPNCNADVGLFKKPTSDVNLFKKPTTDVDLFKKPTTDVVNLFKKPTTDVDLFKKPTTDVDLFKKPTTDVGIFKKPTTDIGIFKKPVTDGIFKKPATNVDLFKKPATNSLFKKPSTDVGLFKKPTSDVDLFRKPTPVVDLFKKSTNVDIFKKPTSVDIFKKPTSDVDLFKKPPSDMGDLKKSSDLTNLFAKPTPPSQPNISKSDSISQNSNLFSKPNDSIFAKSSGEINIFKKAIADSNPFHKPTDSSVNIFQMSTPTTSLKQDKKGLSHSASSVIRQSSSDSSSNIFSKFTSNAPTEKYTSFSDFMKPNPKSSPPDNLLVTESVSDSSNDKINSGFEKSFEMFLKNSEQQTRKRVADEEKEEARRRELEELQKEKERQRILELQKQKELEMERQRELELERQRLAELERQRQAELERQRLEELERQRQWEEKLRQEVLELKVGYDLEILLRNLDSEEQKKRKEHQVEVARRKKEKELLKLRQTVKTNMGNIHARRCLRRWKDHIQRLKINKLDFPQYIYSSIENHTLMWGSVKQLKNHTPFDVGKLFQDTKIFFETPHLSNDNLYLGTSLSKLLEQNQFQARFVKEGCASSTPLVWKVGFRVPKLPPEYEQVKSDLEKFLTKLCYNDKLRLGECDRVKSRTNVLYVSYYLFESPSQEDMPLHGTNLLLMITSHLWETDSDFVTRLNQLTEGCDSETQITVLMYRDQADYKDTLLRQTLHLNLQIKFVHWRSALDVSNLILDEFKTHFAHSARAPVHFQNVYDLLSNELEVLFMQIKLDAEQAVCREEFDEQFRNPNFFVQLFNSLLLKLKHVHEESSNWSLAQEFEPILVGTPPNTVISNIDVLLSNLFLPEFTKWPVPKVSKLKKVLKHFCNAIDVYGLNELFLMVFRHLNPPKENFESYLSRINWNNIFLDCFLWHLRSQAHLKHSYVFYDKNLWQSEVRAYWWMKLAQKEFSTT